MNWGIRTALSPALAVRSGTSLVCQTSQHLRKTDVTNATAELFFTVQSKKYIRANYKHNSVLHEHLRLRQTNLQASPLTFTRGKHTERMSGLLQTTQRSYVKVKMREKRKWREVEKLYCCKAICCWLLMCWSPAMKKICPLMRNLPQPTLSRSISLALCFISSCSSFPPVVLV